MGMFDNVKEKALQAANSAKEKVTNAVDEYNSEENIAARAERQAEKAEKKAEKKAAKQRKQNYVGYATGSHFPIGTKVFLCEDDENSKILELESPNGEIYILSTDKVAKVYPPVLGVIDIPKAGFMDALQGHEYGKTMSIIHGAKYQVDLTDGFSVMLTIILGEPMYKVERVIY